MDGEIVDPLFYQADLGVIFTLGIPISTLPLHPPAFPSIQVRFFIETGP